LTVLRKPDNLAYKNKDDHNMELDEQLQEELPISEPLPEQNHTISARKTARKAVHRLAREIYRVL